MEFCICVYTWEKDRNHDGIIKLVQDTLCSMVKPQYRSVLAQELFANEIARSPRSTVMSQNIE